MNPADWTDPAALKARLARLWERGELLREALGGESRFPLRLALRHPSSHDLTERFEHVRAWAAKLAAVPQLRLEHRSVQHRVQGAQQLPVAVWFDRLETVLVWLGQGDAWQRFARQVEATRARIPELVPWLEKRPLQALELAPAWPQLLAVVEWLQQHPRPGMHLRQVDIPGVHSKFLEAHRAVLAELFDWVLAADAIDSRHAGIGGFAARYGFAEKPVLIRWRPLDPDLSPLSGLAHPDLSLDAASFSRLALPRPVRRVIVTENEINFLTLPQLPGSLAIFGAGYGWDALGRATWLQACDMHYWGDIDTHGFAILDQLRSHFPAVKSLLMDRATLLAHRALWGRELTPSQRELKRLEPAEQALYDELRDDRLAPGLRLEQERLSFGWVSTRIEALAR